MGGKVRAFVLAIVLCLGLTVPAAAYSMGRVKNSAIAMSISHTAYIDTNGTLWTWGSNRCGELGNNSREDSAKPVRVMEDVASVSVSDNYTAAVRTDGTLWMWGSNYHGQLGNGGKGDLNIYGTGVDHASDHYIRLRPEKIMEDVRAVYTANTFTAAIRTDGSLWMWGDNQYGHLGNGGQGNRTDSYKYVYQTTPVQVMRSVASVTISDDANAVAAIRTDGTLWMWGSNEYGQLGFDGGNDEYVVEQGGLPPAIVPYQTKPVKVMENVASVSIGANHTAAVRTDGSLWTWGSNWYGQLGNGSTESSTVPVKVMEGVSAVSLGWSSSAAIRTDGTLWTWGRNDYGQLGDGSTGDSFVPGEILSNVAAVTCDRDYYMAIRTDGTLWAWGWNYNGQLGTGTRENAALRVKIMDNAATVSGDQTSAAAIKRDGSLWTWGDNYYGQLGNGSRESFPVPAKAGPNTVPFTDVNPNSWFYDEVRFAYENGLMGGDGYPTVFNPDGKTTRAMLVTVLYRLEGEPEAGVPDFSDVPEGQWYTAPVAWAAANGIVTGSGGRFDPTGAITRQDFAAILYRYARSCKGYDAGGRADLSGFSDAVQVAEYAKEAVSWAYGQGLINGTSGGRLDPGGSAVRAQTAVILARFLESAGQ